MSLDPPSYLVSLQNNVRTRPIPWEGAVRAGHITDAHLKRIKSVDKVRKEQRKRTTESDLDGFKTLLLGGEQEKSVVESAGKRADVVQYIVVLTGDLLDDVPALITTLIAHPTPYKTFLPLLSRSSNPEDPIPLLASSVVTTLLSTALQSSSKPSHDTDDALQKLYAYLSTLARNADSGLQDIAVQQYSALLRSKRSRELFWEQREKTVTPLVDILRSAIGVAPNGEEGSTLWSGAASVRSATDAGIGSGVGLQLLYHVLLTLWQLSFEAALVGDGLEKNYEIISLYTHLLRLSPKEKITRLLISTLLNLLSHNPTTLLPTASLARLPSQLSNIRGRHLTDPDLLDDLAALSTLLDEHTRTQTTFDQYAAEVRSGHLRWSPPHRNPAFWAEHARRVVDENGGELPRLLAEIMAKPWEGEKYVLAVACNDVGCLVKNVPDARARLEKCGLKARVMALMAEEDEGVRWESLKAVGEWLRYNIGA